MPPLKPTRPVPRGSSAGFFAGRYKTEFEDFIVEEVPAYEPSGQGEHTWLWVEKRGLSTLDLLHEVAAALDRDERHFGVAGLKDARAISRQWISIDNVEPARCEGLAGERFRVLAATRHGNKLRLGHLRGNRFDIVLRGAAAADLTIAEHVLADCVRRGVPNYFGEQRFGKRGANLQKGLDVLHGDPVQAARRMPRRVFGLVLSAVQSEVFNRVVMARRDALDRLLPGDLAFLHKNGAVFPVVDVDKEMARVERFEISASGPMPGPDMLQPSGETLVLEQQALQQLGLTGDEFRNLPFRVARGERRPLRVPVTETAAAMVDSGLRVRFTLPKGAYATAVLREMLAEAIWFRDDHE